MTSSRDLSTGRHKGSRPGAALDARAEGAVGFIGLLGNHCLHARPRADLRPCDDHTRIGDSLIDHPLGKGFDPDL